MNNLKGIFLTLQLGTLVILSHCNLVGSGLKTKSPGQVYTDTAVRHVMMRQGVVGIKVQIMLPHDPKGVIGPKIPLDDVVVILEPKEEMDPAAMLARQQAAAAAHAAAAQAPLMAPPLDGPGDGADEDPNVAAGF